MQPLTGNPRVALTPAQVYYLVTAAPSVEMRAGAERYDSLLRFVQDISGSLQPGATVQSDTYATIHRSCSLVLDANAPFNYLSDYVKPYVVMTDNLTGVSARFNMGMYTLASPTPDLTLAPGSSAYTGYDLLQTLNQPIGDTYEIPVGTNPVTAAAALIAKALPGATVQSDSTSKVTTTVQSWPLDSSNQFTYLAVVNDLLGLVGYLGVWADWDGVFQLRKYTDPSGSTTPVEWTFDVTPGSTTGAVSESRSVAQDLYGVPNTWVYVMNNLTAAPVEGVTQKTFIDSVSLGTSTVARGRTVKKVVFVDALDYPSLLVAAASGIAGDLSAAETFAISSYPVPLFWHRDIVTYVDPALAGVAPAFYGTRRTIVRNWSMPLDLSGGDLSLTLSTLSPATTAVAS